MHNITNIDRQEGLKQAWHNLTQIRPDLAIDKNWLTEWDVEPRDIFFKDGVKLPYQQLVCSDKPEVLIGAPYNPLTFRPITNAEFLKMIEDAVSGTNHKMVSAGSVRGRGRVFVSYELQQLEKYTAGGRKFEPYLNFGDGRDKSSVLWVSLSNICTVCDNTFTMNLLQVEDKANDSFKLQARHTKNVALKLPEMSKIIDKAVGVQAEFATAFESLAEQPCKPTRAERIFTGFVVAPNTERITTRAKNIVGDLMDLYANGKGNNGRDLSDVFSAATDYYTHSSAGDNRVKQFVSSEFGSGAQKKIDMFDVLTSPERLSKVEAAGKELLAL